MSGLSVSFKNRLSAQLQAYGPYAAIGIVVPGGSLILLSKWACKHRSTILSAARRTFPWLSKVLPRP
jgi:hypothetical protein